MRRRSTNPAGGARRGVDYAMGKTPNGWKVYDVVVDGVSLVTNYRNTFNTEMQKSGVDGLIKTLARTASQARWRAKK